MHALRILCFCALFLSATHAAEKIPPVPGRYFNDYAKVISAETVRELNTRLEQFEKDTSSQIVVAIYPKMESDSSIEDYTVRVAQAWRVGQQDKRNGAVLFVFVNDRKMYLQVGYGLEGAIPDAIAKQITEFEIKPHFQRNDYNAGLRAGVDGILKAARGEYTGAGRTINQQRRDDIGKYVFFGIFGFIFLIQLLFRSRRSRRRGRVYGGNGWGPMIWGTGRSWGGGSGGSWGSSGGGFSGGGGSFGGGGAGSSW